jgi:hypothetical protein
MLMSEAGNLFQVEEGYQVEICDGDYLVVRMGATYGSAAAGFKHNNVVAAKCCVHEFKHYRQGGSKFWTARAGVDFFFVIPKNKIELIPEKGYSYVPVIIGGLKLHLNVTGGTGNGWTDWVRQHVSTHAGCKVSHLKAMASVALSPEQCRHEDISFTLAEPDEADVKYFQTICAKGMDLNAGDKVIVYDTTYTVVRRNSGRGGKLAQNLSARGEDGMMYKVKFSQIDWHKTALANARVCTDCFAYNKIGPVEIKKVA